MFEGLVQLVCGRIPTLSKRLRPIRSTARRGKRQAQLRPECNELFRQHHIAQYRTRYPGHRRASTGAETPIAISLPGQTALLHDRPGY